MEIPKLPEKPTVGHPEVGYSERIFMQRMGNLFLVPDAYDWRDRNVISEPRN